MSDRPKLLLVGGGAVQGALLHARHRLTETFDVTWVAPASIAGGHAPPTALAGGFSHPLRQAVGPVERLYTRLAALRPIHGRACLADGQTLAYDRAVCAIGTRRLPEGWASPSVVAGHSPAELRRLAAMLGPGPAGPRVAVVGAGEQALAIAEALAARADLIGRRELWLLWARAAPSERRLQQRFRRLLRQGVQVIADVIPQRFTGRQIVAEDARRFAADVAIWAGAPAASPTAAALGGQTDSRGLCIDRYLRVAGCRGVYAAGATASLAGHPVLTGADAADQARVLAHNLIADWQGASPIRYRPTSRASTGR